MPNVVFARVSSRRSVLALAGLAGLLVAAVDGCSAPDESEVAQEESELRRRCRLRPCLRDAGPGDVEAGQPPSPAPAPTPSTSTPPPAPSTPPAPSPSSSTPPPPAPPPGVTRTAVDCSLAAVQAAIGAASDGEVVAVPAGTCTWSGALALTNKTLTLRGAGSGAGGTKIVYGGSNHALLRIDPGSKTGLVDVSGFWFQGGDKDNWNGTAIMFGGPTGWKNLRIHHNTFDGNSQWTIKGESSTHGLIDHNRFVGTAAGIMLYGQGKADWAAPLTLGTADFFFVEDNVFEFNDDYGSTKHPVMDMDDGGRQVFRYNTVKNGLWETHDLARSGLVSANAYEIYGNTFTATSNQWKGCDVSAGTGVIWGNTFTGDFSHVIGAMDYKTADPRGIRRCDGTDPADQNVPGEAGWRCQYQIGSMGEGPTAYGYPLYLWGNTRAGAAVGMTCTDGCNHVQAGRDYINASSAKPGYTPYPYPHPRAK